MSTLLRVDPIIINPKTSRGKNESASGDILKNKSRGIFNIARAKKIIEVKFLPFIFLKFRLTLSRIIPKV